MEEENVKKRVKTNLFFFTALSFLVYLFWVIFPLINTVYAYDTVDMTYGFPWILVFTLTFNLLPPFLLLAVYMFPGTVPLADLHYIISIIMVIVNAIVVLCFLGYWLVFTNTLYSGLVPFNDYRWCCVPTYLQAHPELCPNTPLIPCMPAVSSGDLSVNAEFVMNWVWAGVFCLIAFGHYIWNRDLRQYEIVVVKATTKQTGIGFGVFVAFLYMAVYTYWVMFPLLNTLYINGYPLFAIPPSPGQFESTLYNYQWVMILFLSFNMFPIFTFLFAIITNKSPFSRVVFYWTTVFVTLLSFIATLVLGGVFLLDCNWPNYEWFSWLEWLRIWLNSLPAGESICNDYRWCCTHFADAPTLCGNVTPCIPEVTNLGANAEFLQHLLFSVIFWMFSGILIWMGQRMKSSYNVFYY